MFLIRGIVFSYKTVQKWEAKLTPILSAELCQRRCRLRPAPSWCVDETYIWVRGRWCYLYRAMNRNGALVDVLSERRDLAAAKALFRSANAATGSVPDRLTSDGHDAYPRGDPRRARRCGHAPDQHLSQQSTSFETSSVFEPATANMPHLHAHTSIKILSLTTSQRTASPTGILLCVLVLGRLSRGHLWKI